MSPAMQALQDNIAAAIDERIRPLFNPDFQSQMHVTVLVRFDDAPGCDVLVTSDDDAGIRAIVERRTEADACAKGGADA